jgi:hypothetical protein
VTLPWTRAVLWGGAVSLDSSRWIYRAYRRAFERAGVPVYHVDNQPENRHLIVPGSFVFAFDVWGSNLGPAVDGVDYLTHNFDGEHEMCRTVEPERHVRLQVYTDDALQWDVDWWDPFRGFLRDGRTLFQPWGTDLPAHQFLEPVWNPDARDCCFVGAVWDDGGLGNATTIPALTAALERRGLRFVHLTQVPELANIEAVRRSRFAPALAGEWQVGVNYLPCRVFKNVSYGQLAVTNVRGFTSLFDGGAPAGGADEIVDWALSLDRDTWLEAIADQQRVVRRYTYDDAVAAAARAFDESR